LNLGLVVAIALSEALSKRLNSLHFLRRCPYLKARNIIDDEAVPRNSGLWR
jgi:hypothetical protein